MMPTVVDYFYLHLSLILCVFSHLADINKACNIAINAGPLLYHFADMPNEFSVEFTWEEIRRIAVDHMGFEILVQ